MIGKTNALATGKQQLEMVNISLVTNQASHEDLVGAVITLSYGEYSEEIIWDGSEVTRPVPAFVGYTVSFGAVEDYKMPDAVSYTGVEGNSRTVVGTYYTEVVSVTLSADDGGDLSGQVVTINGKEHTFDGSNAVEQKVAYGVEYTVSVSAKDGYATPADQTFTASQSARNLSLQYIASALKVNILSNQGDDAVIAAVKAVVSYGDTSVEVGNGEQIGIPTDVSVTVTFPEVEGYKTPSAVTFTNSSGGVVEKTGTYQTEVVTVNVSADNSADMSGQTVTVNGTAHTWSGTAIVQKVPFGTSYSVSVSDKDGYITPSSQSFTANQASRTISMEYVYNPYKITTIRINQTITDPATMITRIVDEGGIEAIRANSHRYTGTFSGGVMTLKQLDDNDGTKYADGTSATLTTVGTDVWMKLPQFYWKCTQYTTNQWDFSVAYGGQPDSTYKEWDGKDLIGVYEAYYSSSKVYSVSGQTSTGSVSQANFKTYARNRGDGFTIVKWKHHCMMAMLFYTQYGHTNCQAKIGAGTSSYSKATGATNALGMEDTVAGGNGDSQSINFWGLENWWGNKYEWVDNVSVGSTHSFTITEDDGSTRSAGPQVATNDYISKMAFGENIDLIPTAASGSETTGFCDYNYYGTGSSRVVRRSISYAYTSGGVACVATDFGSSHTSSYNGSRLAFRGTIVVS